MLIKRYFKLSLLLISGFGFIGGAGAGVPEIDLPAIQWQPLAVDDVEQLQDSGWWDLVQLGARRSLRVRAGAVDDNYPVGDYYPQPRVTGEGVTLVVPRAFARAGERWTEAFVELAETVVTAAEAELEVSLFGLEGVQPLAVTQIKPETRVGLLAVDLRRLGLNEGRLVVTLRVGGEQTGVAQVFLGALPPVSELEPGQRIAVAVDAPAEAGADERVGLTFGVPFPAGSLWSTDGLRLVTADGTEVPSQIEETGHWGPQGSIQWVRFDTVASVADELFVEVSKSAAASGLVVTEEGDRIVIDTGVGRYELAGGASPIAAIWHGGRQVASLEGARGLYVVDQRGRVAVAGGEGQTIEVESSGPIAACVRFEGFFRTADGEPVARHITRIEAFAGLPEVNVTHTLVLSRDTNEVWFQDIGWELSVSPGADPSAYFGVSWERSSESVTVPLSGPQIAAHMVQLDHPVFTHGEARFQVAASGPGGQESVVFEGERMGDWAALAGDRGGLVVAMRDAALQHPSEFDLAANRVNLRFFSGRSGQELDFRGEALVERWGLPEVIEPGRGSIVKRETVADQPSNAIGWSKTHTLRFSPLGAADPLAQAERLGLLTAVPAFAHVDPRWIYYTDALGPVHPKDVANYPAAEAKLQAMLEIFAERRLHGNAFFGFVDFDAGPVFSGRAERGMLIAERRFHATYGFRNSLWPLFARSGERMVRDMAMGSVRTFLDNKLADWDGPDRIRGLYVDSPRGSFPWIAPGDMPMYWEGPTKFHVLDGSDFNNALNDYFLTGYRRAGDQLRAFGEGAKRYWSPAGVLGFKRATQTLQLLLQAYSFTWDPTLRAMAEATAGLMYDPEAELGLFWGVTDKPWSSSRDLVEAWRLIGTPPYYDMAMRVAEFEFGRRLGGSLPGGPNNPFGTIANFLYRETGDPAVAAGTKLWVGQIPYGPTPGGTIYSVFLAQGLYLSQDVLARVPAEDWQRVSYAVWKDGDSSRPVSVAVAKGRHETLDLLMRTDRPGEFGREPWILPLDPPGPWRYVGDRTLVRLEVGSTLQPSISGGPNSVISRVRFGKESPGEAYRIRPPHDGDQLVIARANEREVPFEATTGGGGRYSLQAVADPVPGFPRMVLYAPQGWETATIPTSVYFRVPVGSESPQIYFSAATTLTQPDGQPFADGAKLDGWIDLPAAQPGLWRFDVYDESKVVEVKNLPPFFAFGNPQGYFIPEERYANEYQRTALDASGDDD